jgi:hypothetical protein
LVKGVGPIGVALAGHVARVQQQLTVMRVTKDAVPDASVKQNRAAQGLDAPRRLKTS